MSFLLRALGNFGRSLFGGGGSGGGIINRVVQPALSRVNSFFTNVLGTDPKQNFAQTAMDNMVNKGINAAYDGIQRFSQSNWLQRKAPILAPYIGAAGDALKDRLQSGYSQLMGGGNSAGGGGGGAQPMDGVEKQM